MAATYGAIYAISNFLAFKIFRLEVRRANHLINGIYREYNQKLKPKHLKHTFAQWLVSRLRNKSRYQKYTETGLRRLDKQLDIVDMIRH